MTLGLLDLTIVTDRVIEQLKGCTSRSALWDHAKRFDINYTGLAPDEARSGEGCQVSVYLFHIALDKFYRNTCPTGGSAQAIPEQPLALTLYYLLTASSANDYIQEQQAMSIALKCLHEHPIVRAKVPIDATHTREEQFTLTIEPQTVDDIGRLWQAITKPMRLSAVYRASVVFLEPPPPRTPKVVRHAPTFEAGYEIKVLEAGVRVDEKGFVAITIANAGFAIGVTTVRLRALQLVETTNKTAPLVGRHFWVVDSDTLHVRVPLYSPQGRYLLTVQPTADSRPLDIDLIVPEPIDTVGADTAGLVTIAIDDAHFVAGAVAVTFQAVPHQTTPAPLVERTTIGPLAAGQFRVVDPDTLDLRIPAATAPGRYLLYVLPAAEKPTLEIWVDVP
jgi:hypothetical protein